MNCGTVCPPNCNVERQKRGKTLALSPYFALCLFMFIYVDFEFWDCSIILTAFYRAFIQYYLLWIKHITRNTFLCLNEFKFHILLRGLNCAVHSSYLQPFRQLVIPLVVQIHSFEYCLNMKVGSSSSYSLTIHH